MVDYGVVTIRSNPPSRLQVSNFQYKIVSFDLGTVKIRPNPPARLQVVYNSYKIAGSIDQSYHPPTPYQWPRGDLDGI